MHNVTSSFNYFSTGSSIFPWFFPSNRGGSVKVLRTIPKQHAKKAGNTSSPSCALCLVQAVTLLETVYASTRINQLLAAGVERMALGTNFDLEFALYGTAQEGLATGTAHNALAVGRMDILLHLFHPSYYLLGAGRLAALLLHAGIYNPNEVIISYTAVPVQVLF